MQLGPDAFDESRFVMTFLTILGVAEILCSFRLVQKSLEPGFWEVMYSFVLLAYWCVAQFGTIYTI